MWVNYLLGSKECDCAAKLSYLLPYYPYHPFITLIPMKKYNVRKQNMQRAFRFKCPYIFNKFNSRILKKLFRIEKTIDVISCNTSYSAYKRIIPVPLNYKNPRAFH